MRPPLTPLTWKIGFEIELLAPSGLSRRDLAEAIARKHGGRVGRCFYPQSEPSKVPGQPIFHNLVLGFDAYDALGNPLAKCVDDLTLNADLDRRAPGVAGWHRIVSDNSRWLRLVAAQCDAEADQDDVLKPIADLFGTRATRESGEIFRVVDDMSSPVVMAAGI